MGLDIVVFANVEPLVGDLSEEAQSFFREELFLQNNDSFLTNNDGMENGKYAGVQRFSFRAGAYSSFGQFRSRLCSLALDTDILDVWDDVDSYVGKPFIELINFSDCEGFIGPKTSAKLAKDFNELESKGTLKFSEDAEDQAYYMSIYYKFRNAFAQAGEENGVVLFC